MSLLKIKADDPDKYALALLEALFLDEEMAKSCYRTSKRSTKPGLSINKIELLLLDYNNTIMEDFM